MDFMDLANWQSSIIRQLSAAPDDDFANLENLSPGEAAGGGYYPVTAGTDSTTGSTLDVSRPFFSKTAEAELYLLATNFLLYVAMVIITTLIAKIYFPESLDRGRRGPPNLPRNYASYRRSEDAVPPESSQSSGRGFGISSDAEDEEDVLDSGDDDRGENEDDDDDEEESDLLRNNPKRYNVLEFDQDRTSKAQVMRRLLFCSLMLNITFVSWGFLQERMLTRRYPRHTGDYFTYSYALVFTNRFWTLIMSGLLLLYLRPRMSSTTVIYEYSFPSISNMLSSWCQYEALRYVSFPACTLFKSFKLGPVMMMGKLLGNKTYPQYDYMVALVIGVGIAMFMSSTENLGWGKDYLGDDASAAWTGIMLLFFFLLFDSFTSQFQSRMFQRHVDMSMVELMFATSAFSTILSAVTLIHTGELTPALEFVYAHSEIHWHFFMFSICSTIGQLFIFYTIKNFGAVVFTLIMTTRILLSIALSVLTYGHQVTGVGFLGLMLVLGAVLYRIKRKAEGKQLIKWQGMEDDDKGRELVQEWHEHVDM